jgi:hypothetical protein
MIGPGLAGLARVFAICPPYRLGDLECRFIARRVGPLRPRLCTNWRAAAGHRKGHSRESRSAGPFVLPDRGVLRCDFFRADAGFAQIRRVAHLLAGLHKNAILAGQPRSRKWVRP